MSNFSVKLVSTTKVNEEYLNDILSQLSVGNSEVTPEEVKSLLEVEEGLMTYAARVSSPKQDNPKYARLLKYCMNHGHWSVFEMADATFEIETSRAIAAQILRHRSFSFQEFSQRYAAVDSSGIKIYAARRQDNKNRQNSIDDLSDDVKEEWEQRQLENWKQSFEHYKWALDNGVAKECARFVLPLSTATRLYMKGSIRSWIHYLDLRCANGTQQEHADIAIAIRDEFKKSFPVIAEAKGW
jgi:thymidylate synthase (FAD)